MKFNNTLKLIILGSFIIWVIVTSLTVINTIRHIRTLNSEVDSIINNNSNINYSYTYIPTFKNKTPEEGIDEALFYYGIKHPTIVKAQAILETGHFTSDLCIKNNNLFGLYDSENKRYYSFTTWYESIKAYKNMIQNKYDNSKYYYMFLEDIKYAEDKEYINKLKEIAEELE